MTCNVCANVGMHQCAQCHIVRYCSVDCQRQDWSSHQKVCLSAASCSNQPAQNGDDRNVVLTETVTHQSSRNVVLTETVTHQASRNVVLKDETLPNNGLLKTPPSNMKLGSPNRPKAKGKKDAQPVQKDSPEKGGSPPIRNTNGPAQKKYSKGGPQKAGQKKQNNMSPQITEKSAPKQAAAPPLPNQAAARPAPKQGAAPPPNQVEGHPYRTVGEMLKKGQEVDLSVVEVESPSQFWAQISTPDLLAQLHEIQGSLNSHFAEKSSQRPATQAEQEGLVAAIFPMDHNWYRAQVLRQQGKRFHVRYVDFGNKAQVDNVYALDQKWHSPPAMAALFGIGGIQSASRPWSAEAVEYFKAQLGDGNCRATVIECSQTLALIDIKNDSGATLSQCMVAANHASFQPGMDPSGKPTANARPTSVPHSAPTSSDKRTASTEPPVKMAADLRRKVISPGPSPVQVIVLDAASPLSFTIQLTKDQPLLVEVIATLKERQADYTGKYMPKKKGQFVLAQFSEDGEWYRAEVMNIQNEEAIQVLFLDFGNQDIVSTKSIAQVTDSVFEQYPVLGITCALSGMEGVAPGKTWDQACLEPGTALFNAVFTEKSGEKLLVELTKEGSTVSVNKQLVEAGVLLSKTTTLTIKDLPTLTVPLAPETVDCLLMDPTSPTNLYLQLVTEQTKEAATAMSQILTTTTPVAGYAPSKPGEVVLGQFKGDWYRAEVLERSGDTYKVLYIDYGNVEDNTKEQLAPLLSGLEKLAPLSVTTKLAGVKESSALWNPQMLKEYPQVKAKITKKEDGYEAELFDENNALINAKFQSPHVNDLPAAKQLPLNSPINVHVIHVESPTEFYVLNDPAQFAQLRELMDVHVSGSLPQQKVESQGQLVCCLIEGDTYRMAVTELSPTEIKLVSLDYGFSSTLPPTECKQLPSELLAIPRLASLCCLSGMDSTSGPDLAAMAQPLAEMVLNQQVRVVVTEKQSDANVVTMTLMTDEACDIGKMLREQCLELPQPPKVQRTGGRLTLEMLPASSVADTFRGAVSHAVSPQEFYVQMIADVTELQEIEEKTASTGPTLPPTEGYLPEPRDLCLALNQDGAWYRAVIKKRTPQGFLVNFIDYGDDGLLPAISLRPLTQDLAAYSPKALHCCIAGVFPKDGKWSDKAIDQFREITQNVACEFQKKPSNESFYLVDLVIPQLGNIGQALVTSGFADHRERPSSPAVSSEGNVSALEEENAQVKAENEALRKKLAELELMMGKQ